MSIKADQRVCELSQLVARRSSLKSVANLQGCEDPSIGLQRKGCSLAAVRLAVRDGHLADAMVSGVSMRGDGITTVISQRLRPAS